MKFQHLEDRVFFEQLLCEAGNSLESFSDLFDFRPPEIKRREFNAIRTLRLAEIVRRFGDQCMLRFAEDCDSSPGVVIDHLIPLSSNKLNKQLRDMGTSRFANGVLKKAPTQSFGSNNPRNLVLACHNCNSLKQNGFIPAEKIRLILHALTKNCAG